jgi:HD-like signal output (HDOD) protein
MKPIDNLIEKIGGLPTLPTIFAKISQAVADPNVNITKLAKLISSDQATAIKILKVVNSTGFGLLNKVNTISDAIMYLGFNEVKNIVYALSVMNQFRPNMHITLLAPVDLWSHSIAVGIISRLIAAKSGETKLENYFLGGIFHDIGKLFLYQYASEDYDKALKLANEKQCLIKDAELAVLGIDHMRIGKLLADKWNLPDYLSDVLLYHNSGICENENKKLVASIHIGDIVARFLELGKPGDDLVPHPNPKVWEVLNLPEDYFQQIRIKLVFDHSSMLNTMFSA